ncbi:hypothetical protein EXIGLDRAFT_838974 [Exidia glandulosa HHB12029]|uniref:Association with the SNF1 complex (ASC) domain-containing protein n=1 Tax=Exidia glandulosa HHB12029 TaxID=1314781 RepID=A0A166A5X9_EXIGL|nr:hypothetical protein EXIGLDRAFT_838974 [Exidia glandulosa HHB12029]
MGNTSSSAASKQQHAQHSDKPHPPPPPHGPIHHSSPTAAKAPPPPPSGSTRPEKAPLPLVPPSASSRIAEAKRSKRSLEFPDFQIQPLTAQRRVSSFVPSEPIPIPGSATATTPNPYVRPVNPDSESMQDLVVPVDGRPAHPNRMPAAPLSPIQSKDELHQSSDPRGPRSKARNPEYTAHEIVKSSVPLGLTTPEVTLGASQGANSVEVPTLVTWSGRGKDVWVEDTWNGRTRLTYNAEKEIFSESVLLPVGNMSLKFIVDDELKLSPDLPMASDDDGALVNYITVTPPVAVGTEPPASRDYHPPMWSASRWLKEPSDSYSNSGDGVSGSPPWTNDIPQHLVKAQAEEEAYNAHRALPAETRRVTSAPPVPIHPPAPTLPRHLDKVILSSSKPRATTPKAGTRRSSKSAKREREAAEAAAAGDDDAVLPVPSHVVLHHLGTSAIRDGVIAVADTVRYRKKFITTVYYKPMAPATPDPPPSPPALAA